MFLSLRMIITTFLLLINLNSDRLCSMMIVVIASLVFLISTIMIPLWQQILPMSGTSRQGDMDTFMQQLNGTGMAWALSPAVENSSCINNVAFVRPSFTYAAYRLDGFYNFYRLYDDVPQGTNVTTDLNLLTAKIPHEDVPIYTQKATDVPAPTREKQYIDKLIELVRNRALDASLRISDITDKEVSDGKIFNTYNNSSNAYDVLFLFHQEYVTSAEYYNLKKFVANGGTIVFNDSNILTTEVTYDSSNDSVTLVEGHNWKYDGQNAWRAEQERWANETAQWVGSNFLPIPTKNNVTFTNNPFGYNHTEEQYVTNPNDRIILNFGAIIPDIKKAHIYGTFGSHPIVAVYELDHSNSTNNNSVGKLGKVISLSIFSYKLSNNKEFLDFYAREIIPLALGQCFRL